MILLINNLLNISFKFFNHELVFIPTDKCELPFLKGTTENGEDASVYCTSFVQLLNGNLWKDLDSDILSTAIDILEKEKIVSKVR